MFPDPPERAPCEDPPPPDPPGEPCLSESEDGLPKDPPPPPPVDVIVEKVELLPDPPFTGPLPGDVPPAPTVLGSLVLLLLPLFHKDYRLMD